MTSYSHHAHHACALVEQWGAQSAEGQLVSPAPSWHTAIGDDDAGSDNDDHGDGGGDCDGGDDGNDDGSDRGGHGEDDHGVYKSDDGDGQYWCWRFFRRWY